MSEIVRLLDQPGCKYIISYDIACKKRWRRIHRLCVAQALAVQFSFFLFIGTRQELMALVHALHAEANSKQDDIRVYQIKQAHHWIWLGRPLFPEGVSIYS